MKILLSLSLAILLNLSLSGQSGTADSLAAVIEKMPGDTAKIRKISELADIYYRLDLKKEGETLRAGYRLARQLNTQDWLNRFQTRIGANFANTGAPDSALHYFELAEKGFLTSGNRKELASVFSKKRWVYNYLGDLEKALEYAFRALEIYTEMKDEPGIAIANSYVGEILYAQEKYQEAADYAFKGYEIQKRLGLKDDLAYSCQNLGDAWLQLKDYDKALAFQDEGLALRQELKLDLDAGLSLNSRGNVYKYMERYPEALADYRESLALARKTGFPSLERAAISNIGHILNLQGKYREALPYHLANMRLIQQDNERADATVSYRLLAEAYGGTGRFDSAWHYQKLYSVSKDSLLTEETSARMSELQAKYETAQREAKIAVQEEELRKHKTAIWAVVSFLVLALVAGGLLWRLSRKLRKRNREKEFLIKEIHHRVKNNLQILSSLLHLQSKQIQDDAALDAVREGQSRVEAMGLIHQKLYMGDNLASVDMQDYLHNLGETLLDAYKLDEEQVKIIYHLDPLRLDVDTAIPLGLIINELVTNSLKYAFPGGRTGTVEIFLRKNAEGKLHLKVADNGVGKNGAPVLQNSTSFGTKLVDMLSKKLKGTLQVTNGDGYATEIKFEKYKTI